MLNRERFPVAIWREVPAALDKMEGRKERVQMVKTTDLVAAMRCSCQAPTASPPCTTCAYRLVESLDGKEYTSCDCDRMGMDAADRLEELVDRCARYAEEIAVLREKVNA